MKKVIKVLDFISATIEWFICIILVLLIIVSLTQRFSRNTSFFGYRIYVVASDSMIPIYTVGDTLLVKDVPPTDIKVGDALTYMGEEGEITGLIITHQVTEIEKDENNHILFHTRGVANNVEDPIVREDQVFGKVAYCFFTLSLIGKLTSNMLFLFLFVSIPLAIIFGIWLFKVFGKQFFDFALGENDENDNVISKDDSDDIKIEKVNVEELKEEKKKDKNK